MHQIENASLGRYFCASITRLYQNYHKDLSQGTYTLTPSTVPFIPSPRLWADVRPHCLAAIEAEHDPRVHSFKQQSASVNASLPADTRSLDAHTFHVSHEYVSEIGASSDSVPESNKLTGPAIVLYLSLPLCHFLDPLSLVLTLARSLSFLCLLVLSRDLTFQSVQPVIKLG